MGHENVETNSDVEIVTQEVAGQILVTDIETDLGCGITSSQDENICAGYNAWAEVF